MSSIDHSAPIVGEDLGREIPSCCFQYVLESETAPALTSLCSLHIVQGLQQQQNLKAYAR